MTDVSEQTLTLAEHLALRGRKRLACAKNAIAWAIFGTEDEEEITISEGEGIACERAAIRALSNLRDAGLLDNEPLLGLATTREILAELQARGQTAWEQEEGANSVLHYYATKALEDLSEEHLDYTTKAPKDLVDDYGTININSDDDVEKEVTQ